MPHSVGINIHFTDPLEGEMAMLAATGAKWIRMDFKWGQTERVRGVYDFSAYERLLSHLEKHDLRAVFIFDYGNKLYSDVSPATPESRAAYARWAAAAAQKFAGRGVLWEIWNEPNIGFWRPQPNPADYVALVKETATAARAVAPGEALIAPAIARFDWPFLEACFRLGMLDFLDAVSIHPYRNTVPETVSADYGRLREMIQKHGPKNRELPILSGEWGYTSQAKERSEAVQARFLTRQWLSNLASGVPLSIWYDWRDDGLDANERENRFGLVRHPHFPQRTPVFAAKPAYFAAQTFVDELNGFTFAQRIANANDAAKNDWILRFSRGSESVFAVWTTAHDASAPGFDKTLRPRVYKLPPNTKWRVVSHLGEELPPAQNEIALASAPLFLKIVG